MAIYGQVPGGIHSVEVTLFTGDQEEEKALYSTLTGIWWKVRTKRRKVDIEIKKIKTMMKI